MRWEKIHSTVEYACRWIGSVLITDNWVLGKRAASCQCRECERNQVFSHIFLCWFYVMQFMVTIKTFLWTKGLKS